MSNRNNSNIIFDFLRSELNDICRALVDISSLCFGIQNNNSNAVKPVIKNHSSNSQTNQQTEISSDFFKKREPIDYSFNKKIDIGDGIQSEEAIGIFHLD